MPPDHAAPSRPIRVALSNDYEIALLGLAEMLGRYPQQVQIVDITTNPSLTHEPDVILFDTFGRVPEDDRKLRRVLEQNSAKVVVYSWDDYPEEAATRLGAVGYLSKSLTAGELVAAIAAIHDGDQPRATETPDPERDEEPAITWPGQALGLTEREAEMLTFIVRGLTNDEIARRCYLSINTVKTYVRTAYRKIGVSSRAQAVVWGFRNGFAGTDDTGL
jgi:NarL family two-component system response regulator LiaR